MQQWEHICILGEEDLVFDEAGREVSIQGYLNQMGRSGWELVAVTPHSPSGSAGPCFAYWFKRPCSEGEHPRLKPEPSRIEPLSAVPSQPSDDEEDLVGGFAFGYPPIG